MAPPSTPAQPRFLLPKSQKANKAAPLQAGQQQFASTPRFNAHKTTPRETAAPQAMPPFSAPAQSSARARATQYEPLGDSIDTSPVSSNLPRDGDRGGIPLNESIEVDSQSPPSSREDPERPTKRRRVSISPIVDAMAGEDRDRQSMVIDDDSMIVDNTPVSDDHQDPDQLVETRTGSDEPTSPIIAPTRHPMFLSAPRFKTSEAVIAGRSGPPLPDAFSPQRRGAKYVAGGLAAELRDWLVQVKGPSEYDRPEGESVQFYVHEVRACHPGEIRFISGTEGADQNNNVEMQVCERGEEGQPANVILAGGGRLAGLGGRQMVAQGQTLSLFQPMWNIVLEDLGRFAVACDWDGDG